MSIWKNMQKIKKVLAYNLLDKCGLKTEYIGKIVYNIMKNKGYSPYLYIQIYKLVF
jgi:hypothetical protein